MKSSGNGVFLVAGNENSGNGLAFKMSEAMLEKKIQKFREEYGDGSKGMVSWPMFCDYIGYSEAEVAECYQRGKECRNAYSGRAVLLERFRTAVRAMTKATSNKQQNLANREADTEYLLPAKEAGSEKVELIVTIQSSDGRIKDIAK